MLTVLHSLEVETQHLRWLFYNHYNCNSGYSKNIQCLVFEAKKKRKKSCKVKYLKTFISDYVLYIAVCR